MRPGVPAATLTAGRMELQQKVQKIIYKQIIDGDGFTTPLQFIDCNRDLVWATFCLCVWQVDLSEVSITVT